MGEKRPGKQGVVPTENHSEDVPDSDVLATWTARISAESEMHKLLARDATEAAAKGGSNAPSDEELAAIRARAKQAEDAAVVAQRTWSAREVARQHDAEEQDVTGVRPAPGKAH